MHFNKVIILTIQENQRNHPSQPLTSTFLMNQSKSEKVTNSKYVSKSVVNRTLKSSSSKMRNRSKKNRKMFSSNAKENIISSPYRDWKLQIPDCMSWNVKIRMVLLKKNLKLKSKVYCVSFLYLFNMDLNIIGIFGYGYHLFYLYFIDFKADEDVNQTF